MQKNLRIFVRRSAQRLYRGHYKLRVISDEDKLILADKTAEHTRQYAYEPIKNP